ncbi:MAG: sulfatase-like hydrolase/transferase [Alphaproteobacteria bacterium]|nr:sulfatase-like hydrolase/transferase [Alphaproteobacteria bacterium]
MSRPTIPRISETAILILGVLYASVLCLFIGSNIPPLAELKEMGHHALDVLIDEAPISTFLTGCVFLIGYSIKRKKNWRAMAIAFIALLWAFYFKAVFSWLSVLGIDSLAETQNFDTNEAWFYASTLKSYLKPLTAKSHIIIYTAGAGFLFVSMQWAASVFHFQNKVAKYSRLTGYVFLLAAISITTISLAGMFIKDAFSLQRLIANFDHPAPQGKAGRENLVLVTYIGESTTSMNMGLYGYPRNTTPRLSELAATDRGFIQLHKVFSTHTHTNQSLLEALSLGLDKNENVLPIDNRQRLALTDLLDAHGLKTYLFENQRRAELGNFLPTVVFKPSEIKYSDETRLMQGNGRDTRKPFDHIYFRENLRPVLLGLDKDKGAAIFLHSYAGHGPYLNFIPSTFQQPVDNTFDRLKPQAIIGEARADLTQIEAYDSAIRYVDYSVANSIEDIRDISRPVILIYFSDHGESVFTNSGHDSARFMHAMARVPFILYFNKSAQKAYPDLYEKYKSLAAQKNMATLAQLPSTILDLFQIKIDLPVPDIIGVKTQPSPILVRETSKGVSYTSLTDGPLETAPLLAVKLTDNMDEATSIFRATHSAEGKKTSICYHRANTLAKALRGALIADCLEIDLVVEQDGTLSVTHPPVPSTGLTLSDILKIVQERNLSLWIDSKNLTTANNCRILEKGLKASAVPAQRIMIEFPSTVLFSDRPLVMCARDLIKAGYPTSFYIPMKEANACAQSLANGSAKEDIEDCATLRDDLTGAYESRMFTDYSFDYPAIRAMEALDIARQLKWNTWSVSPDMLPNIQPDRFRHIIMNINDPNNL